MPASTLNGLFDNMGPGFASYVTGQNIGQDQDSQTLQQLLTAAKIQQDRQQMDFSRQEQPGRMAQQAASLEATLAGTRGTNLLNQQREMNNAFTTATQPGLIDATNMGNQAKLSGYNKQMQSDELQMYNQLAARFSGMPGTQRVIEANALVEKYGQKLAQDPVFQEIVGSPQTAARRLSAMVAATPANQAMMSKVEAQGDNKLDAVEAKGQMDMERAKMIQDAMTARQKDLAQFRASIPPKPQNMTFQQYSTALSREAVRETDPDKKRELEIAAKDAKFSDLEARAAAKPAAMTIDENGNLTQTPAPGNAARANDDSGGGGEPKADRGAAAQPQVGEVRKGYRFKGGDPSKASSWEKQ